MHFCDVGTFISLWQVPPATSWQTMERLSPSAPHKALHGHYVLFLPICHCLNLITAWHCFNLPFTLHQGGTSPAVVSMKRKVSGFIWAAFRIHLVLQGYIILKSLGLLHFRTLARTQLLWHQVASLGRFMYINLNLVTQFKKKKKKSNENRELEEKKLQV